MGFDSAAPSLSRNRFLFIGGLALLGVLAVPPRSSAQITTIKNLLNVTTSTNWSAGTIWQGGVPAGASNIALFDLAGNTTIVVDTDVTIAGFEQTGASGSKALLPTGTTLTVTGTFFKSGNSSVAFRAQTGGFQGNVLDLTAGSTSFGAVGTTQNLTLNSLNVSGKTTISAGASLLTNVNTYSNKANRGNFAVVENNGSFSILTNTGTAGVDGGANVDLLTGSGTTNVSSSNSSAVGTLHIRGATGSGTYSGVLGNGAADNTLVLLKSGNSSQTLSGDNTFDGSTTVSGGLLIGDHDSAFGTGGVTVNGGALRVAATRTIGNSILVNGGTLNVRGEVSGGLTFGSSGGRLDGDGIVAQAVVLDGLDRVVAPGNSPGILSFESSQAWSSFTYEWELNSWSGSASAGTNFDRISITGSLDLTSASENSIRLDLVSLLGDDTPGNVPGFTEASRQWAILTASGGIVGFDPAQWSINPARFSSSPAWGGDWEVYAEGNQIFLAYAVPEPSAVVLGGAGLVMLLVGRRYRANREESGGSRPG